MEQLDQRKEIRFSSTEKKNWLKAMSKDGYTSLSAWIRETCNIRAEKVKKK